MRIPRDDAFYHSICFQYSSMQVLFPEKFEPQSRAVAYDRHFTMWNIDVIKRPFFYIIPLILFLTSSSAQLTSNH